MIVNLIILSVRSLIPVKIYFHANEQFLDLSGRMGYKVFPGEIVQSQVTYEDISLLSR